MLTLGKVKPRMRIVQGTLAYVLRTYRPDV